MRVFINTNVILDFLQEREPFVEDAEKIFALLDTGEVTGFIAATTITNIYYIVNKASGKIVASNAIREILTSFELCPVNIRILEIALTLEFDDFEDAVQYACAAASHVDVIITRDLAGFAKSEIPVILPKDFSI